MTDEYLPDLASFEGCVKERLDCSVVISISRCRKFQADSLPVSAPSIQGSDSGNSGRLSSPMQAKFGGKKKKRDKEGEEGEEEKAKKEISCFIGFSREFIQARSNSNFQLFSSLLSFLPLLPLFSFPPLPVADCAQFGRGRRRRRSRKLFLSSILSFSPPPFVQSSIGEGDVE